MTSGFLAGARDDDLLRARLEVLGRGGALGEAAGGLDDDVGAELLPGQLRGVGLAGHADAPAVDDQRVVLDLDRAREDAVHGVVLEQMAQRPGVGEVVDRHELEVGALPQGRADDEPADAAEAVDAYTHTHLILPFGCCESLPERTSVRGAAVVPPRASPAAAHCDSSHRRAALKRRWPRRRRPQRARPAPAAAASGCGPGRCCRCARRWRASRRRCSSCPARRADALVLDHLQVPAVDHGRLAQALGGDGGVRGGAAARGQDAAHPGDHGDVLGDRVRPQQHDVLVRRLGQQPVDLLRARRPRARSRRRRRRPCPRPRADRSWARTCRSRGRPWSAPAPWPASAGCRGPRPPATRR